MLTPEQIDKIVEYRKKGYTYKDIAEKVKCSVSSVKKYLKPKSVERVKMTEEKTTFLEETNLRDAVQKNREMIFKILEMLFDDDVQEYIYSIRSALWNDDDVRQAFDRAEIAFWKHLFSIDSNFAKEQLEKGRPYEDAITDVTDLKPEFVTEEHRKRRSIWVEFLKEYAPELLLEFI